MPRLSDERLTELKAYDRPAFDFANSEVKQFFERAAEQGYSLDTTGFLAHPGFFQAPHSADPSGQDIVMVGSTLDLGAIGLAGARHDPQAVREASRNYGPVTDRTGNIPFVQCAIADYGDVPWSGTALDVRLKDIEAVFYTLAKAGCYTLNCGGEHTTSYGALSGLARAHDDSFGLVHIDAHCDTMASWGGDAVNDGSVFRQAVLEGYIDPEKTVQIGIRGRSNFLWEFSHDVGMTVITADEVFDKGTDYFVDLIRERLGQQKAYFSFDVDGLDSSYMMSTTGPEPFGLTPRQVRSIIHGVSGLNFIGADMVELNPSCDPNGAGAWVAAALFFELLSLLADCRSARMDCGQTSWIHESSIPIGNE